jgi:hypothetical protein
MRVMVRQPHEALLSRTLPYQLTFLLSCTSLAGQVPNHKPAVVDTIPADSVCSHTRGFAGPCVTLHGRVRTYSDNVLVGLANLRTGHKYEVQNEIAHMWFPVLCALPKDISDLLAHAKLIYADFVIRPLTRDRPGFMGYACIASSTHVVTRAGGLDHPLFRPRLP